jgi:hypothetical protein
MRKKTSRKIVVPPEKEELMRVLKTARSKYGKYPGVLGVAVGVKYQNKKPTDEVGIVFYVEKKGNVQKELPRYVYGHSQGKRKRIKTDVIQVGQVTLACGAGAEISSLEGGSGTITLFFRNKIPANSTSYYILTCSHVVGTLTDSPPVGPYRHLKSHSCPGVNPFADTLKNSTIAGGLVPYDIALAQLSDDALAFLGPNLLKLDGSVMGTSIVLTRILASEDININDEFTCAVATHGGHRFKGRVRALATELMVTIEGRTVQVSDLCTLESDEFVQDGDSGGLIYLKTTAIGIIVARSPEGWAWFHPLDNALDYVNTLHPAIALKIFA